MSLGPYEQTSPREPRLVVIAGPPGAGKGTQCSQLATLPGVVHISIGESLRREIAIGSPIGTRVHACVEAGRLVPDVDVFELIASRLVRHRTASAVLLDGFPRTIGQAEMLERLRPRAVGLVILLELPLGPALQRLRARERADDTDPNVVAERILSYARDTKPVLDWYASRGLLAPIDASAAPHRVTERITEHLAAFGLDSPPKVDA